MIPTLYILVLKDKSAFKVGITETDNLDRIKQLNKIYQFDLLESYIINAKNKKTTHQLEKQILSDYKTYKHDFPDKTDGYSEFIKYEQLQNILSEIEFKKRLSHLEIKIQKNISFKNQTKQKALKQPLKLKKQKICQNDFKNIDISINFILKNKSKFRFVRQNFENYIQGILYCEDKNLINILFKEYRLIYSKHNIHSIYEYCSYGKNCERSFVF